MILVFWEADSSKTGRYSKPYDKKYRFGFGYTYSILNRMHPCYTTIHHISVRWDLTINNERCLSSIFALGVWSDASQLHQFLLIRWIDPVGRSVRSYRMRGGTALRQFPLIIRVRMAPGGTCELLWYSGCDVHIVHFLVLEIVGHWWNELGPPWLHWNKTWQAWATMYTMAFITLGWCTVRYVPMSIKSRCLCTVGSLCSWHWF